MEEENIKNTLFAYFAGKATPKQKRQIELWLNSNDQNQETFFLWMEEWEAQNPKYDFNVQRDFEILKERILVSEQQEEQGHARRKKDPRPLFLPNWAKIAAALLPLLISVAVYLILQNTEHPAIYQTNYGEIQTITLPDHSEVVLNANSKLTLSSDWNEQETREVWLEGEAFFSVVHTENHQKFIVQSNNIEVEVLGTEFNVNDRGSTAKIVLNSGKVQLKFKAGNGEDSITMAPGELVEYTDMQEGFKRTTVNPQLYTSWRNNKLIFEHTPVHEVIQLLEDNFGLEVVLINEDLLDQTFTATLPANDADILLKALSKSFGLSLSREGNRVVLD